MTNTDLENALKVMIGSQEAEAMYIGSSLLWSNTPQVPYDSKVEYLYVDTNKNCYIDTGIIPDENTGVYAKLYTSHNNDEYIIGLRNNTTDTRWLIGHTDIGWYCGYGQSIFIEDNRLPYINAIYEIELNFKNSGKMSNLTNNTYKNLSTLSFTPANSITIFKANCFDGALTNQTFMSASCRIYGVKISQGNDIIMDLIPVRVGLTGYMYDKISKRLFGNLGTGSFILGPDIVEIEYLESSGTLYINTDTPSISNKGLSGSIVIQRTGDATGELCYLGRTNTGGFSLLMDLTRGISIWSAGYPDKYLLTGNSYFDKNMHEIEFSVGNDLMSITVDNTLFTDSIDPKDAGNGSIQLFAHNGSYRSLGRIYSCKLYYNNTLIHDLIPVRIDLIGYMYDKVSNQLFGNSGTGSFILGPDTELVGNKIEIEYLENNDSNCYIDTGISTNNSDVGIDCLMSFGTYEHNKWSVGYNSYQSIGDTAGFLIGLYNNNLAVSVFDTWRNKTSGISTPYSNANSTDLYHITINCLDVSVKVNNTTSEDSQITDYGPRGGNIYLYCRNGNLDKVQYSKANTRIYYFKIYLNNNVLVRDFIPVRVGQMGYLYDKVTGQFFRNSGSGTFVLGPDKT